MNGILVPRQILLGGAAVTANGTLKFGRVLLVVMTFLGVFRWKILSGRLGVYIRKTLSQIRQRRFLSLVSSESLST